MNEHQPETGYAARIKRALTVDNVIVAVCAIIVLGAVVFALHFMGLI